MRPNVIVRYRQMAAQMAEVDPSDVPVLCQDTRFDLDGFDGAVWSVADYLDANRDDDVLLVVGGDAATGAQLDGLASHPSRIAVFLEDLQHSTWEGGAVEPRARVLRRLRGHFAQVNALRAQPIHQRAPLRWPIQPYGSFSERSRCFAFVASADDLGRPDLLSPYLPRQMFQIAPSGAIPDLADPPSAADTPSQHGEDVFLADLFGAGHRGTFVEAGAFDGYQLSVTWLLARLGWSGLLIEPVPQRAIECAAVRPESTVVAVALAAEDGETTLNVVGDDHSDHMLSFVGAVDGQHAQIGLRDLSLTEMRVPTARLEVLLTGHFAADLDVLVLDVEGAEELALAGLPGWRIRPRLIMVEDNVLADPSDINRVRSTSMRMALTDAGYVQATDPIGFNRVFVRRTDASLVEHAVGLSGRVTAGVSTSYARTR